MKHQNAQNRLLDASTAKKRRKSTTTDTSAGLRKPSTVVFGSMTEREFQATVVKHLRRGGWTVWTVPNMRLTAAGLPDVLAVHPERDVLLAWELKSEKGRIRPEQRTTLAILERVPGVYARVVRPSDWPRLRDAIDADPPSREV